MRLILILFLLYFLFGGRRVRRRFNIFDFLPWIFLWGGRGIGHGDGGISGWMSRIGGGGGTRGGGAGRRR